MARIIWKRFGLNVNNVCNDLFVVRLSFEIYGTDITNIKADNSIGIFVLYATWIAIAKHGTVNRYAHGSIRECLTTKTTFAVLNCIVSRQISYPAV